MTNDILLHFEQVTHMILDRPYHFSFRLNQLPKFNNDEMDIRKEPPFQDLFTALDKKEHHCLYWFELPTLAIATQLNTLLDESRPQLKGKRLVPATNKNTDSNVLYVGIRRGGKRKYDGLTNISGRIIQHLGYYKKGSTQGLQFVHWAAQQKYPITLKVVEFPDLPNKFLNIAEHLIAHKLRPLCGRH